MVFLGCCKLLAVGGGWGGVSPGLLRLGVWDLQQSVILWMSVCVLGSCLPEANIGLWFPLGAGNGKLINSSCVHLRNKGCL